MKLIFCGTPAFAVPTLRAVAEAGHEIALVVTQPDRPSGRGLDVVQPAVKVAAAEMKLPVTQPEKIKNNSEFRASLEQIAPDAIVVVAYGRIIPKWMLDLPRFGNVNLHGSLLPKYRGAAPVQWAIANGESETGVTTMLLNEGLDTGDMLLAHKVAILPDTTAPELFETLAAVGAPLMVETLRRLEEGVLQGQAQDEAMASHAPLLTREDGLIDFTRPARETYDRWRGFLPWPGAYTQFRSKRFAVLKMSVAQSLEGAFAPGLVVARHGRMFVACGQETAIELLDVQVEGKSRVSGSDLLRGYQVRDGERLGG